MNIPCVFESSWPSALARVRALVGNKRRLRVMSRQAYRWYARQVLYTRGCVYKALGLPTDVICRELQ